MTASWYELLADGEKAGIAKALDPAAAPTPMAKELAARVHAFLRDKVRIKPELVDRWASLEPDSRSRLVSELIWRVTCIYEASETAVQGITSFDLGYGFHVTTILEGGRPAYLIE